MTQSSRVKDIAQNLFCYVGILSDNNAFYGVIEFNVVS